AAAKVVPDPQPAGLIFITSASGTAALPPQTVQLFASSKTAIAFQAAASVADGSGWLSVSPATGSTSAAAPASIAVTANADGLKPGVYRGSVSFSFGTTLRTVNVTLIVQTPLAGPAIRRSILDAPLCAGAQLVPTQTGLVSNFSAPASWPTPLAI